MRVEDAREGARVTSRREGELASGVRDRALARVDGRRRHVHLEDLVGAEALAAAAVVAPRARGVVRRAPVQRRPLPRLPSARKSESLVWGSLALRGSKACTLPTMISNQSLRVQGEVAGG